MDITPNSLPLPLRVDGFAAHATRPNASFHFLAAQPGDLTAMSACCEELDISPYWAMLQQGMGCDFPEDTTTPSSCKDAAKSGHPSAFHISAARPLSTPVAQGSPEVVCQVASASDSSDGVSDSEMVACCLRVEAAAAVSISHGVVSERGDGAPVFMRSCPLTSILGYCPGRLCPTSSAAKRGSKRCPSAELRAGGPPHSARVAQTYVDTPSSSGTSTPASGDAQTELLACHSDSCRIVNCTMSCPPDSPASFSGFERTW